MKDNFGDKVTVSAEEDGDVGLYISEKGYQTTQSVTHFYTPAKARKLARKLKAAADELDPPVKVADDAPDVDPDEPAPAGGCCGGVCGEPESDDITLTLTREQARRVAAVLGKVSCADGTDSVYTDLLNAGADYAGLRVTTGSGNPVSTLRIAAK